MKLLYCDSCGDIFNLKIDEKKCSCGKTSGRYVDHINATYSGDYAYPLGFNSKEFLSGCSNQPVSGDGYSFSAFVIPEKCTTFAKNDVSMRLAEIRNKLEDRLNEKLG